MVVLLRGVNVGGHKSFRPTILAEQLKHLDAVNIGAAGTLVIRRRISRTQLRAEVARRLPFNAEIIICEGKEILALVSRNPFARRPVRPGVACFVNILSRRPRLKPPMPVHFPPTGRWLLQILGRQDRFVFGVYRRHMKAINYLGMADRLFGVVSTTRGWNTVVEIARVLSA
jgi:uncharacterized protein (DUF1697 family)